MFSSSILADTDLSLTVFRLVLQDRTILMRDVGDGSEGYPLDNGG